MKEFMLLIRNKIDHQYAWSSETHHQFLKDCESYIKDLEVKGKLISAQPLLKEGIILSGKPGAWEEVPLSNSGEVQVGYYHILAENIDDAIEIARLNPEFEFGSSARIEIRPVKAAETTTGFVYPSR